MIIISCLTWTRGCSIGWVWNRQVRKVVITPWSIMSIIIISNITIIISYHHDHHHHPYQSFLLNKKKRLSIYNNQTTHRSPSQKHASARVISVSSIVSLLTCNNFWFFNFFKMIFFLFIFFIVSLLTCNNF